MKKDKFLVCDVCSQTYDYSCYIQENNNGKIVADKVLSEKLKFMCILCDGKDRLSPTGKYKLKKGRCWNNQQTRKKKTRKKQT